MSDDELAKAYRLALNYAKRQAGSHGDETAEALQDAATDGVMNARDRFDPARCTAGFGPFCMAVVKTRVRRAQRRLADRRRREPSHSPLPEDFPARELPAAGGVPMTPDLRDLPPDLRDTVRLVYVDGYSYEDAGLLLGVSNFTVSERLRRAAHMLAPDGAERPERRPKEKRVRGGKGH